MFGILIAIKNRSEIAFELIFQKKNVFLRLHQNRRYFITVNFTANFRSLYFQTVKLLLFEDGLVSQEQFKQYEIFTINLQLLNLFKIKIYEEGTYSPIRI